MKHCLVTIALILSSHCTAHADQIFNEFLFSEDKVASFSRGKFKKQSTFLWGKPISLLALNTDTRKTAATYGFMTAQTNLLQIGFAFSTKPNFFVFGDVISLNKFIDDTIEKNNFTDIMTKVEIEKMKNILPCTSIVHADSEGRAETIFATNFFEYGSANFSGCLSMMGLRSFGVSLPDDYFAKNPQVSPMKAFEFLADIYRSGDRQQPFASISPR